MNSHQPPTVDIRKSLFITLLLFGLILSFCSVCQAQTKEELEKLIRVDDQMFMSEYRYFNHGYLVYRAKIQNLDKKRSHRIELKQSQNSKNFELKPGESINVSLPIPVSNSFFYASITVEIDSRVKKYCSLNASGSSSPFWAVLISRSLRKAFSGAGSDCIYAQRDCEYWPQDRLDYSCLDMIFLTPDELVQAPEGVQNALRQFVQAGGELVLFDCKKQSESLEKITWINQIRKETKSEVKSPVIDEKNISVYMYTFGNVFLCDFSVEDFQRVILGSCPDEEVLEQTLIKLHGGKGQIPSWYRIPVIHSYGSSHNNWQKMFPVVGDLGIPRLGICFVIILFVLLAGPINWIVLKRKNKRILLLVTVPALSLVFAGAILIYTIVHEGFQTDVRISSVACLDQRDGTFVSMSQLGVYARTRAKGISFEPNDELNYVGDATSFEGDRLGINWTTGMQQLASNFAPVKTPVYYKIRKTGTTRLKLDFDFKASEPFIVNGLGKDIKTLYVCDENGSLWTATDVHAGQKVALKLLSENKSGTIQKADGTDIVSKELSKLMLTLNWGMTSLPFSLEHSLEHKISGNSLPANTYIVTFDSPGPFVNKGISYAIEKNCFSFIFGKF